MDDDNFDNITNEQWINMNQMIRNFNERTKKRGRETEFEAMELLNSPKRMRFGENIIMTPQSTCYQVFFM